MISINTDLGNHKTRSRQTDIETHRTEVLVTEAPLAPPVVQDRTPTPVATRYVINKKEAALEAKKNSAQPKPDIIAELANEQYKKSQKKKKKKKKTGGLLDQLDNLEN